MNKAYNRINWENYPSDSTPLNEDNLNKMDVAIDEVDNRVISLDTTKLPVATAYTMVKDVEFDEKTGVFTITKLNGSVIKIDTALEKISTNFRFDYSTQKLILTLIDGTPQEVDLSALLTQYEFTDSDTIAFTIDTSGKVVASVKKGSITQDMLEPNYLANIKVEVAKAESASLSADTSAKNAKTSETNAKNSEIKAKEYAEAAGAINTLISSQIVGTNPTATDSTDAPIISQIINGYTVQDGTPTSDTPVEIESLGELQEDGSYKVAVKTCGKNLFNPNTVISGEIIEADGTFRAYTAEENYTRSLYSRSDYIPCNANTNYYFENVMPLSVAYTVGCYDENKQFLRKLSFSGNSATVSGVLNTGDNTKYMVVCYKTTNVDTVMVAKSDTATEYEPYTETTAEFDLSEPLYEGDYIKYRADGSGVLHRSMCGAVFDGSDDEGWGKSATTGTNRYYVFLDDILASLNNNFLCSQARKVNTDSTTENFVAFITPAKQFAINTNFSTLAEWKAHLQANPMKVVYELAEPVVAPLTAEQVAQFKQLYTFEPVTNVFCDGEVELLYYKNTDNGETVGIVHKKVEASEKAIEDMQTVLGGEIDENTGETNVEYSVPQEVEEGVGIWQFTTLFGGPVVNALKQATKAITEEFVKLSSNLPIKIVRVTTYLPMQGTSIDLDYPDGFNIENTCLLGYTVYYSETTRISSSSGILIITFHENHISVRNNDSSIGNLNYCNIDLYCYMD